MATLDYNTGILTVSPKELGFRQRNTGLRRGLPEIERDIFTLTEGKGLRRYKRLTFDQINFLRRKMPSVHSSIEFLKSRMIVYPYRITRTGGRRHNNLSRKRAARVDKLLQGPNKFGHTYRMLISMMVDNGLERDLMTMEKALSMIRGIDQLGIIDSFKMRPKPVDTAGDFDSSVAYLEMSALDPEQVVNTYKADEIVWSNFNPQAGGYYGFSPIEVLDKLITMSIYADEHNIKIVHPNSEKGGGIVWLGDVGADIRAEFEERYETFRKSQPSRPVMAAGGDKAPTYLDLDDEVRFEWDKLQTRISEMVVSVYGLNMRDIGLSSVTGKGSAGTAEIEDMITLRSAIVPRLLMLQDILTVGVVRQEGGDDLQLEYMTKKEETLEVKARAGSMALGRGAITLNEYRALIDETLEPYEDKIGDVPLIIAGNQVYKVEDLLANGGVIPGENVIDGTEKFSRATEKQNAKENDKWTK